MSAGDLLPLWFNLTSPSDEEINRIRDHLERWRITPDFLNATALAWSVPRLLARLEYLENELARRVSASSR